MLVGVRQTGKTSLLSRCFPELPCVSLDIPRVAEAADTDGDTFLAQHGVPLFIDEVQYAPQLFRYLKASIDSRSSQSSLYVLTGSESFSLMEGISESLAGRISLFELLPLSLQELEGHFKPRPQNQVDFLWDCVLKCGYPEVYQKSLEPGRFYADYLATYLQRDVRRVLNVKNLRLFDRFLRLLASQSGQLLSVNRIANDLGVSATTLREWVDVFEVTNIVRRLEPWSINVRKRVVKTPKLFFLDTGILCHLLGIETMAQLKSSPMLGQIFESFVFAEFLKNQWNRSKKPEVYFYRDYAQKEVDFVLHSGISLSLF